MNIDTKIICVGNSKTCTTSLLKAFLLLEYPSVGYRYDLIQESLLNPDAILEESKKYKFLKDWPWVYNYKLLDHIYPNSKFILTIRDESKWAKSFISFITDNYSPDIITNIRINYYGFNPLDYLDDPEYLIQNIYRKKNREILEYFENRKDELLILDIINEENPWIKLCEFIGEDVPDITFPVENVGSYKS